MEPKNGDLKKQAAELNTFQQHLIQSQKMQAIERLSCRLAHDFNNLLTVILGYCNSLIQSLQDRSDLSEDLQEISKAAEQASILTHQLLTFGCKQVLNLEVLNLNYVISNMETMIQRILGENIHLQMSLNPGLGEAEIDPFQMQQILLNLILNARDAMPDGGRLTIETMNIDSDLTHSVLHLEGKPGPYILLSISDTGIGMDENVQSHIFEPFFTNKEKGKGIGLGLSTVYGIVKQSGGSIEVHSKQGHGTTFKIYFPRVVLAYSHSSHSEVIGYKN